MAKENTIYLEREEKSEEAFLSLSLSIILTSSRSFSLSSSLRGKQINRFILQIPSS